MKYELKEEKNKNSNLVFYSWISICDKCGKVIQTNDLKTTKYPNLYEMDYCIECMRKLLDEGEEKERVKN